jgi:hypothetical protein
VASIYRLLPWGDAHTATVNNVVVTMIIVIFRFGAEAGERDRACAVPQLCLVAGKTAGSGPYMGSYDFTNPQRVNRYAYLSYL